MQDTNVVAFRSAQSQRTALGCEACMRRTTCPLNLANNSELEDCGVRIVHLGPVHQGQHVIREGDKFDGFYVVRSGTFKSFNVNADGETQITGFHFPGEIFGMEGIDAGVHSGNVVSLDTGSLCRIPVQQLSEFTAGQQALMLYLLKIMDQVITRNNRLIFSINRLSATQRLAEFLADLFTRARQNGLEGRRLVLHMSRGDIANYIGLAMETVSRLFSQFDAMGVLSVNRRSIELKDMEILRRIVRDDSVAGNLLKHVG